MSDIICRRDLDFFFGFDAVAGSDALDEVVGLACETFSEPVVRLFSDGLHLAILSGHLIAVRVVRAEHHAPCAKPRRCWVGLDLLNQTSHSQYHEHCAGSEYSEDAFELLLV